MREGLSVSVGRVSALVREGLSVSEGGSLPAGHHGLPLHRRRATSGSDYVLFHLSLSVESRVVCPIEAFLDSLGG